MKKNLFIAFTLSIVLILSSSLSLASTDRFITMDTNKDGKISKKEYAESALKNFDRFDVNRDGVLSQEELQAIPKINAKKFLKEVDTDGDGQISREEFVNAADGRFRSMDRNRDGKISRKEYNVAYCRVYDGQGKGRVVLGCDEDINDLL